MEDIIAITAGVLIAGAVVGAVVGIGLAVDAANRDTRGSTDEDPPPDP